jgi:tryptophan synthase alpha chain
VSRIKTIFRAGHKALIAYVTVGYPSIEDTLKVVPRLANSGVDIVELGIPFSDPLADGITIQKASFQALQNGITPETCLKVARHLREKTDVPLVFMTYYNPVFSYGLREFVAECAKCGIDGLIIPDLPPEEGAELQAITQVAGLDLIYLLAPNSSEERIKLVAERSRGFIYLVSVTGVTGARKDLPPNLSAFAARVRTVTRQPLCIGFGISRPEQAIKIASLADGIIVGSRLIQLMAEDESLAKVQRLVVELRRALDSAGSVATL